ncbi:MAG TPA: zf-HC2 domain-containing protein [Longimicrobiales bacterium]|nr:zf-HC2 domain-containing protein [Longimicrobiales bacterium]
MNGRTCGEFRDRLVEFRNGSLPALEAAETQAHTERCAECAAELALLGALARDRRSAPRGFAAGVLAAYRVKPAAGSARALRDSAPRRVKPAGRTRFGRRALPMAVAAAGILLAGVVLARGIGPAAEPGDLGLTPAEASVAILPWPGHDGVLAGAPALDVLSNDEIEALLEELDS